MRWTRTVVVAATAAGSRKLVESIRPTKRTSFSTLAFYAAESEELKQVAMAGVGVCVGEKATTTTMQLGREKRNGRRCVRANNDSRK